MRKNILNIFNADKVVIRNLSTDAGSSTRQYFHRISVVIQNFYRNCFYKIFSQNFFTNLSSEFPNKFCSEFLQNLPLQNFHKIFSHNFFRKLSSEFLQKLILRNSLRHSSLEISKLTIENFLSTLAGFARKNYIPINLTFFISTKQGTRKNL